MPEAFMRLPLVFVLTITLGLTACGGDAPDTGGAATTDAAEIPFQKEGELTFVHGGGDSLQIDVEIADTDSTRARGLMQRASLPERSGMLFIFDRQRQQSFWMANTPLSLDILFVDQDSVVVDIDKYTTPYSQESVESDVPARYVVEVPAGFTDTHGIVEGDRVTWRRTPSPEAPLL